MKDADKGRLAPNGTLLLVVVVMEFLLLREPFGFEAAALANTASTGMPNGFS